jgi:PAS domain S-box-containing protein
MRQKKRIQGRQGRQLKGRNLQILVETIPALMWKAEPDGHIDYVNKRLLEYFGSPLEEIIGWGWMEKAHPDDVAFKVQSWLSNLEAMTSHDANCRFQGADGAYRWFNVRGEPLRHSDGSVQNWYGVLIDTDERKNAEDRLRRSEAHLAEAERLSHTGAVAYNGKAILFASDETYRIWGFDTAQGLPSRDVVFQRIHPDDRDRVTAEVRREVGEKRRYLIGYRIVLPDGTVKHLETVGQPVFSRERETCRDLHRPT